jgi:hypothetical protein
MINESPQLIYKEFLPGTLAVYSHQEVNALCSHCKKSVITHYRYAMESYKNHNLQYVCRICATVPIYLTLKRKIQDDMDVPIFQPDVQTHSSKILVRAFCTTKSSTNCKQSVVTRNGDAMRSYLNHSKHYTCFYCAKNASTKRAKVDAMNKENILLFDEHSTTTKSHELVRVSCSLQIPGICLGNQCLQYYDVMKAWKKNNGVYYCLPCHRTQFYTGRTNPNCKYNFDDHFMHDIDTEFKAYFLGWVASDGTLPKNGIIDITIHSKDVLILQKLGAVICPEMPIRVTKVPPRATLQIASKTMSADCCRWLKLEFIGSSRKKSAIVQFPTLNSTDLQFAFLRGYFDGDGCISVQKKRFRTSIGSNSKAMLEAIFKFVNLPGFLGPTHVEWSRVSSLYLLQKLYGAATIYLQRKYQKWLSIYDFKPLKMCPQSRAIMNQLAELRLEPTQVNKP